MALCPDPINQSSFTLGVHFRGSHHALLDFSVPSVILISRMFNLEAISEKVLHFRVFPRKGIRSTIGSKSVFLPARYITLSIGMTSTNREHTVKCSMS
jgi:hypothetical protein